MSFVPVCFGVLALVSSGPGVPARAASAPSAALAALLAKARVASGAPYRFHIVSRSEESHDGATFTVTTESQGLKYRAKSCSHALCTGFYFDGEHSYNTNFNDTPLPVTAGVDGLQLTLRAIATYAFTDPNFVADGGTIEERDSVLRDGKKFRRISVAPRFGALLDAIVDPQSGLVVGVISDERKYAFEFGDQRRIGRNVTLPFSISLNGYTFTKYEQRSISGSDLEPPEGVVPAFASSDGPVAMVKRDRGEAPVVPCTIGGESVSCLLDTGDSGLSMSLELAKRLHLSALGGSFDDRGAGRYVSGVAEAPTLTVGNATYPTAHYVVLHDLAQNGYDVTLGADAFAHARVTIDYKKREVAFDPSAADATGGLPISFDDFVPVLPVVLDGKSIALRIDTGNDGAIGLSKDFVERHPELSFANGTANVRVGSLALKNQTVDANERLSYNGRVGSALLDRALVTIDYARGTISLASNAI